MVEKFMDYVPEISDKAMIHPSATIIGRCEIAEGVSIWPGVVIRGDVDKIKIGKNSNVQDNSVFHPNLNRPVIIGENVTVGHSAVVHGSVIGNNCLIGMNATVIESEIGENCLIGAGCLITPNSKIPPNSLVLGLPFKVVKQLSDDEIKSLKNSADEYLELAKIYDWSKK
jgi:carbonic anhydrase/acetyltransferase-like protein (isoleucine patch superfamily)